MLFFFEDPSKSGARRAKRFGQQLLLESAR